MRPLDGLRMAVELRDRVVLPGERERAVREQPAEDRNGLDHPHAPVFVQSFEFASLRSVRGRSRVRLIQLVDDEPGPVSDARLKDIASYADGVGLNSRLVIPAGADRAR